MRKSKSLSNNISKMKKGKKYEIMCIENRMMVSWGTYEHWVDSTSENQTQYGIRKVGASQCETISMSYNFILDKFRRLEGLA